MYVSRNIQVVLLGDNLIFSHVIFRDTDIKDNVKIGIREIWYEDMD
jgi:hypothetical protein